MIGHQHGFINKQVNHNNTTYKDLAIMVAVREEVVDGFAYSIENTNLGKNTSLEIKEMKGKYTTKETGVFIEEDISKQDTSRYDQKTAGITPDSIEDQRQGASQRGCNSQKHGREASQI